MKTLMDKIHITLFAKALAMFIAVMLPVYALGVIINVWGHNSVRKEQMESSRMSVMLYFSGLEFEFRNALRQQLRLMDQADMTFIASSQGQFDDIEYFKAFNSVRRMLKDIKDSSSYITEVDAYLPAKDMMLSTAKGLTDLPADYARLKEITQTGKYPFFEYEGEILSCVTSDFFLSTGEQNTFLLVLRLSREKILSELKKQDEGIQRRAALVSTGNGLTVANESEAAILQSLTALAGEKKSDHAQSGTETMRSGSRTYLVTWAKSGILQTTLLFYMPTEQLTSQLATYRVWIIALSVLSVASIFLFSVWIRHLIITPLNKLVVAYRSLEKGDFNVTLQYRSDDEFGFLYKRSNEMIKRLGTLIEQVYEQKIHAREAELKQLQYQINPHFLYNSILIISSLIKMTDYECAGNLTHHLGNYYQHLTKGADFVPFSREVTHARDYVEIQAIRFADRFAFRFDDIPKGVENLIVPRLILQPLIENAFKYGLANTVKGGLLYIGMALDDGVFRVTVEDNGSELADETIAGLTDMAASGRQDEGTGLMNVHRRIQIQFGRDSGLYFRRSALGGLCVEIRIWAKGEDGHV